MNPKKLSLALLAAILLAAAFIYEKAASGSESQAAASPRHVAAKTRPDGGSDPALLQVGIPSTLPSLIQDYTGFTLSFNPDNRTPNYVAWNLTAPKLSGSVSRSNDFWQDSRLKNCPGPDDYRRSGFDRGHLCPAADQKWSSEAMTDCFSMANMCPQSHSLNSGAWNTLEQKCRTWADRYKSLVIIAGPIYEPADTQTIGPARVRVPSAFFKVILAPDIESPCAIGFIYPNMSAPGNMKNYSMSVDQVEQITGFDFFSALPDPQEKAIEARQDFTPWQ